MTVADIARDILVDSDLGIAVEIDFVTSNEWGEEPKINLREGETTPIYQQIGVGPKRTNLTVEVIHLNRTEAVSLRDQAAKIVFDGIFKMQRSTEIINIRELARGAGRAVGEDSTREETVAYATFQIMHTL